MYKLSPRRHWPGRYQLRWLPDILSRTRVTKYDGNCVNCGQNNTLLEGSSVSEQTPPLPGSLTLYPKSLPHITQPSCPVPRWKAGLAHRLHTMCVWNSFHHEMHGVGSKAQLVLCALCRLHNAPASLGNIPRNICIHV